MQQPGARIVSVNSAFEDLTGYSAAEAIGQNCRFLQGPATPNSQVLQLSESVRAAEPAQLVLTNYRKDGTRFSNNLSVQPVHDSLGVYRYNIGVLADNDALFALDRGEEVERVRRLMPRRFEVSLSGSVETSSSNVFARRGSRMSLRASKIFRQESNYPIGSEEELAFMKFSLMQEGVHARHLYPPPSSTSSPDPLNPTSTTPHRSPPYPHLAPPRSTLPSPTPYSHWKCSRLHYGRLGRQRIDETDSWQRRAWGADYDDHRF